MSQNLISLNLPQADLEAIDQALSILEQKLAPLVELPTELKRGLVKMGDKSEAFCRQTLIILAQNPQILPTSFDLQEATRDLAALDQLRPRFQRLHQLASRANDTETALGSDLMSSALDGYALAKVFGKGAGLETLKEAMSARYSRKRKPQADTPA